MGTGSHPSIYNWDALGSYPVPRPLPTPCQMPIPPPQWSPPLRRRLGRRKGRPQEDKGREGWRFWRKLSGGPLVWKTPRAVRQLSGSEEKGDIDPCLSLQLCPSRLGSLLFLESKAVQRPRPSAYHCPRTWLVGGGGRVRGLGCLADEEKPHTSLQKEGTEQGRPVHDPHPWHRPRHGHRVPSQSPVYLHLSHST